MSCTSLVGPLTVQLNDLVQAGEDGRHLLWSHEALPLQGPRKHRLQDSQLAHVSVLRHKELWVGAGFEEERSCQLFSCSHPSKFLPASHSDGIGK